ncbi:hypothetical protein FGIG_03816 [Fasciola gigantica]|uniref:MAM domain-containing protein n=1 Tax=Fasciola gigantica TaxID=46835 RepID=A0A504YBL9_FASGI|nr:hypothetical protein FGIG_03816 [Fasciola gigantica]
MRLTPIFVVEMMLVVAEATHVVDPFICSFDADLCGWSNDPNNWRHAWLLSNLTETHVASSAEKKSINKALCLSKKHNDKRGIYTRGRSASQIGDSIQARLWSPQFLREDMIRCLSFTYRIDRAPHSSATLALMQRQEG